MAVELWAALLDRPLSQRENDALLSMLPPERRERILRVHDSAKWREPLCAYAILRQALWELYRWKDLPEIGLTAQGKPGFPAFPTVHFNLSHTSGAVLETAVGSMQGRYDLIGEDGTQFDAPIPPFTLSVPRTLH